MMAFFDKHFEKLIQLLITVMLLVPAWYIIIYWGNSNVHMILGTNVISAVTGFWLGSSYGSAIKDKILSQRINPTNPEGQG